MERDKLWNSLQIPRNELSNECFFNPTNWDNNSTDFALTSIVSSPATSNLGIPATNNIVVRELIGRLGSICNSGEISPHSFIAANNNNNNIPPQLNLTTHLGGNQLPSGFAERAAKFSSFGGGQFNGSQMGIQEKDKKLGMFSRSSSPEKGEFGDSMEESSVSEQIPGGEIGFKGQTEVYVNPKKRKAIPRGKAPSSAKAVVENEESDSKRSKGDEGNAAVGNHKQTKDNSKTSEPPKDYIHVRARRGQATDSHSLAERVRREKISERMKFLQDLVPGCNKVTGKAVMLDEIINYVQSLQQQVEFLSMKLSTVNPRMDFNMEDILSKDIFQSGGSLPLNIYPVDASPQTFPYTIQSHQGSNLQSNMPNGTKSPLFMNSLTAAIRRNSGMPQPSVHGYSAGVVSQISSFWDDDLQNVVQMGFGQNQHENDSDATNHMKVEL